MLTIKDLAVSKSLDRKEMSAVCGGYRGGDNNVFQFVAQDAHGVGNTNLNMAITPNTNVDASSKVDTRAITQSLSNVGGLQAGGLGLGF